MLPLQPADWPDEKTLAGHAVTLYPIGTRPLEGCLVSTQVDNKDITLFLAGNRYYSFRGINLFIDDTEHWLIGRYPNGTEAFAVKLPISVPVSH